jgi:hypothetical protein
MMMSPAKGKAETAATKIIEAIHFSFHSGLSKMHPKIK